MHIDIGQIYITIKNKMKSKFLGILPFLALFSIVCNSCYLLMEEGDGYCTTIKQMLAVVFTLANLVVYFCNFRTGLIITGIVLLFSSLSIFTLKGNSTSYSWFFQFGSATISTPNINLLSFCIFLFYCIVNRSMIKEIVFNIVKWMNN